MSCSRKSAAEFALALALLAGCGAKDGSSEFAAGETAFKAGDYARAARNFEECLVRAPGNVDALVYRMRTEIALGNMEAAAEAAAKARELAGGDSDVRLLSAEIAYYNHDSAGAAQAFTAIAEDLALDATVRAQGWAGLGIVEMGLNHFHLARVAFLKAIRLDRRNPAAWYHLALVYRDGLHYAEAALEHFEIFVRLEPAADARVQRVERRDIPALKDQIARSAVERPGADKRDSAAAAAKLAAGEAAWKKSQFKTARLRYQEALAADPLSYPAAMALAKAELKVNPAKAGQNRALANYLIACKLRPSSVKTFLTAGELAVKLSMPAQAVEIYSRAVAANPASLDAVDGLIRAFNRVGGKGQVAKAYQQYREMLPTGKKN